MPSMSFPGFCGGSYRGRSYMADDEVCLNWFLEKNESPNAPQPYVMLPTPGFEAAWVLRTGPIRGLFYQRGRAFAVAGYELYELFEDATHDLLGEVENDGLPVTFSANGDAGEQIWITSGGTGYIFDLSSDTLSTEGPSGATVSMGGFLAGRFLALDAELGALYASNIYDGSTWNPLAVAQSETGNPWRALVVTPDNLIHLLGESSSICYADQGGPPPMPLTPIRESGLPYGITSPWAWSLGTTLSWVAQSAQGKAQIVRANGYGADRISTHAIEDQIQHAEDISDAIGWYYQEGGHEFDVFTFATDAQTWVFDRATGLWHGRDYWDTVTATSKAYRPGCMMVAFGHNYVGDRLTALIYRMSTTYPYDVDVNAIRRVRQPPRLALEQRRMTIDSLQLVMDVGQGIPAVNLPAVTVTSSAAWGDAWGDSWGEAWGSTVESVVLPPTGANPQMMLQVSRDGGKTFPLERWAATGYQGEWNTRVYWQMLGQARNFTPRFIATDPVPFPITDCLIDFRVGRT